MLGKQYIVRQGDTLWDIAKEYDGVTVDQIKRLNNIRNTHRLKPGQKKHQSRLDQALTIGGRRLGDTVPEADNIKRQPLWIEGEAFHISRDPQGHHWISRADGSIVFAWQTMPRQVQAESGIKGLHLGDKADRVFKTLGVADRKITLSNGSYLAYDEAGIAIQIQHNKINGWFIY